MTTAHQDPTPEAARNERFEITVSRHFATWLAEVNVSLAFTNPPLKLYFIGLRDNGQLSVFERTFPRCLGIAAAGDQTVFVSSRHQIWRLENVLQPVETTPDGYDRLYVPRQSYVTGSVGTHDVAVDGAGRLLFVNTRFGCLAEASEQYSFVPLWRPPFLPDIVPGDRCHLNGLALRDGQPAYMTCVSETAEFDSWRDQRRNGGAVYEIATNRRLAGDLSMPHSPRWYRERLWLTSSGRGQLGFVDFARERFEPFTFAPGFLRGLCFVGDYAVVGSSRPRRGDIYSGLDLDETLAQRNMQPRLGLFVIDLRNAQIVHWLFIDGNVRELYDVVALPGVRRPTALGLVSDEIARSFWFAP